MERALDRTDPGIGQTVIRGLFTDRLMVRRELCHLISWITAVSCADIVSTQIARTLKSAKAPSRCSQHIIPAAAPPFPHTRPRRRPAVKGVSRASGAKHPRQAEDGVALVTQLVRYDWSSCPRRNRQVLWRRQWPQHCVSYRRKPFCRTCVADVRWHDLHTG